MHQSSMVTRQACPPAHSMRVEDACRRWPAGETARWQQQCALLFLAAGVALVSVSGYRSPVRPSSSRAVALSQKPAVNPEVQQAAHTFEQSNAAAQAAERQLEEVEDNVPRWMAHFGPSTLQETISSLENGAATQRDTAFPKAEGHAVPEQGSTSAAPGNRGKAEGTGGAAAAISAAARMSGESGRQSFGTDKRAGAAGAERMLSHLKSDVKQDPKLHKMDAALSAALQKAKALRRAAVKKETLAHAAAAVAKGLEGASGGKRIHLSARDDAELGKLFKLNTVLSKVSRAKQRAYKIAIGQTARRRKDDYGAAEHAVVSEADMADGAKAAPQQKRDYDKRMAHERAVRRRHEQEAKDKDLAKAESKAAMKEAAQVLLRQLHGNRDRWLKATLQKIAGDVAAVDNGHAHIKHMSRSIEAQERELARAAHASGSHAASGAAHGLLGHSSHVASLQEALKQPESVRQQTEATRLLDHMLHMAHADFSHMKSGQAKVLDTEAKDGKLMRETGAEAAQTYQRRQNWRRRHEAIAQAADAAAARESSQALRLSARGRRAALQVAQEGAHGRLREQQEGTRHQSWVGELGSDLLKDVGF